MSFDLLDGTDGNSMGSAIGKPIQIFRNGECDDGKPMVVSPDLTTDAFLAAAGRRLGLSHPKRIFLVDGTEVDDILVVQDDETVFISEGAEFRRPEGAGVCIAGYEVKHMLGKGGFGEVRLGQHIVTKQKVALKFMSKASMGSASAAERVATEIHCLTALHHPSVIRMFQVINQVDFTVLVFEYAAGGDLFEYVSKSKSGHLNEAEARHIFRQILSAVAYAHNHNICHGDLKLENILLANRSVTGNDAVAEGRVSASGSDGNHEGDLLESDDKGDHANSYDLEVKVADFGLSVFVNRGEKSKAVGGSTSYMSPEVWNNEDIDGPALDVWCLGCILFSMLCGRLPFDDGKISEFRIPDDATMISRTNSLDYKFNMASLSEEAKGCVARQLIVDKSSRASIPMLFNHPWMVHRRDSEVNLGTQAMLDLKAVAMLDGQRRPSYLSDGKGDSTGGKGTGGASGSGLDAADFFGMGSPGAADRNLMSSSPDMESFLKFDNSPKLYGDTSALPPLSPLNATSEPDPFGAETTEADAATALIAHITTLGPKASNKGRGNVLGNIKRQKSKSTSPMLSGKTRENKALGRQESGSGGGGGGGGRGDSRGDFRGAAAGRGGVLGAPSPVQHSPTPPPSGTPKKFKGKKPGKFGRKQIRKNAPKGVKSKKSSTTLGARPK